MKKVIGLVPLLALVLLSGCTMNKINEGYLKERPGYTNFATPIYARGEVVGFGTLASDSENETGVKFVAVRYHSVAYDSPTVNARYNKDYLVRYAMKGPNTPSLKVGEEVSLGFIVMKNSKKPMHAVPVKDAFMRIISTELPALANMETAPLMYLNVTVFVGLNDPPYPYIEAVTPAASR